MKNFLRILTVTVIVSVAFLSCGDDDNGTGVNGIQYTWQVIFEDNFNSQTMDPKWILMEGDANNFFLTDSTIAMDDTDANQDGPVFVYDGSVTNNRIRVSCKLTTFAKTGDVEFALIMRATDEDNAYVMWIYNDDTLTIDKIDGGTSTSLAMSDLVPMGANETRLIECEYNHGTITFKVSNAAGLIGSVTADDPSPLPAGTVGFIGELDGSENEYLYLDDFKLEEYVKVTN